MNYSDDIILENTKIRIEPLKMIHFYELLPIALKHPNLLQFSPSPFGSEDLLKSNFNQSIEDRANNIRFPFVIFDKVKKKFIGSTSFGNISIKDKRLEIGWTWIDKDSQGTGINKQCKFLLLSYAFNQLAIERVGFRTDSRNMQSRKAIEKIGGIYEGILRSDTLMLDGHRRDTVCYSILKSEWESAEYK